MSSVNPGQLRRRLKKIYNSFLTAHMSREYYACRLTALKRFNLAYEILLALGSSSAIAAWYFWKTPTGMNIWIWLTGLVALFSTAKPIIDLPKKIETYSKLYVSYTDLSFDLGQVVEEIEEQEGLTQ